MGSAVGLGLVLMNMDISDGKYPDYRSYDVNKLLDRMSESGIPVESITSVSGLVAALDGVRKQAMDPYFGFKGDLKRAVGNKIGSFNIEGWMEQVLGEHLTDFLQVNASPGRSIYSSELERQIIKYNTPSIINDHLSHLDKISKKY